MPGATTTNTSSFARERSFADPKALMAIRGLELRARVVVEGFWNGLHSSPYHGFSVEFTEYRQYSPGDDTRYLDWRLYARSDRSRSMTECAITCRRAIVTGNCARSCSRWSANWMAAKRISPNRCGGWP